MSLKSKGLQFTGERVVPGQVEPPLWTEHIARYAFAANFVADRRVLDFACGTGYGSALLRSAGARQVVGVDLSLEAVYHAHCTTRDPVVQLVASDCLNSSIRSGSIDVVVSFETIEHVTPYQRFLSEARRVLAPGGLLILSTPNKRTYSDEGSAAENPYHTHEFYLDEFRLALAEHFSAIELYGQTLAEGVWLSHHGTAARSADRAATTAESVTLLTRGTEAPREPPLDGCDFFVALCGVDTLPELDAEPRYFQLSEDNQLHRLRRKILKLQEEFDDRMAWALKVEQRLEERGDSLLNLQGEFDERTLWALSLDTEVARANASNAELQAAVDQANARLRAAVTKISELEDRIFELRCELASKDEALRLAADADAI